MESSSIKISNERIIWVFSLGFKLMEIVECKTPLRNQCPRD
jgi:hypothetical protein